VDGGWMDLNKSRGDKVEHTKLRPWCSISKSWLISIERKHRPGKKVKWLEEVFGSSGSGYRCNEWDVHSSTQGRIEIYRWSCYWWFVASWGCSEVNFHPLKRCSRSSLL
jgi:hypothetical protein